MPVSTKLDVINLKQVFMRHFFTVFSRGNGDLKEAILQQIFFFCHLSFGEWKWWELGFLGTLGHRCYRYSYILYTVYIHIKI